jgi:hypothetical protein
MDILEVVKATKTVQMTPKQALDPSSGVFRPEGGKTDDTVKPDDRKS